MIPSYDGLFSGRGGGGATSTTKVIRVRNGTLEAIHSPRVTPAGIQRSRCYLCVPELATLVKRSRDDLVAPGIVECDSVHHVAMPIEGQ